MSTVEVSKIVNIVQFKIDNGSYKRCQDKIKRIAGLWSKVSGKYQNSLVTGKKIADINYKNTGKQIRSEIKSYKSKQATLKADQIRYKQQITADRAFRAGLQKTNMDFLKGNISAKERSAILGQLNKQYKSLTKQATVYSKIRSGFSSLKPVGSGLVGGLKTGAIGAAAIGGAGLYGAANLYDKTKTIGQDFESLIISIKNTFGEKDLSRISNTIRDLSNEMGQPILDIGKGLTNYVSIVKSLGIETNKAIDLYKKQSNMTAAYGMTTDQVAGFQYGLTQTLASNTLEDFKQAMDWSPQIKGDLLAFVKRTMGVTQKDFMQNLTNGKYNFKDVWLKFVEDSAPKYEKMSQAYKQSSIAQDARTGSQLSLGFYRIFETSGFKEAMKVVSDSFFKLSAMLENNAKKIGEIFGSTAKLFTDFIQTGIQDLNVWLKNLTVDDIKTFFGDVKTGLTEFATAIKNLTSLINSIADFFGSRSEVANTNAASLAVTKIPATSSNFSWNPNVNLQPQLNPTLTGTSISQPQLYNMSSGKMWTTPPDMSGKLDVTVNANFKTEELSKFVDLKIEDNNTRQINMIAGG